MLTRITTWWRGRSAPRPDWRGTGETGWFLVKQTEDHMLEEQRVEQVDMNTGATRWIAPPFPHPHARSRVVRKPGR